MDFWLLKKWQICLKCLFCCHTERSEVSIDLKRFLIFLDFSLCANALRSK